MCENLFERLTWITTHHRWYHSTGEMLGIDLHTLANILWSHDYLMRFTIHNCLKLKLLSQVVSMILPLIGFITDYSWESSFSLTLNMVYHFQQRGIKPRWRMGNNYVRQFRWFLKLYNLSLLYWFYNFINFLLSNHLNLIFRFNFCFCR